MRARRLSGGRTPAHEPVVVLVGEPGDQHADRIATGLEAANVNVIRTSLDHVATTDLDWRLSGVGALNGSQLTKAAGLWRRPGNPSVECYDSRFGAFAADG